MLARSSVPSLRIPPCAPLRFASPPSPAARFALALTACSGGNPDRKQINPPRASLQQLTVLPNGQWRLVLRLQNFSNGRRSSRA
jgi:hypothetical protein